MRYAYYLVTLALLPSCGEPAEAADTNSAVQTERPRSFDVAGVALGDSAEDAEATLRQRGYDVQTTRRGWTVEDHVQKARADSSHQPFRPTFGAVNRLVALRQGERVDIEFRTSGSGSVASSINYASPAAGRTGEQLAEEIRRRYENVGRPHGRRICALAETKCRERAPRLNYLQVDLRDALRISLYPGTEDYRRWDDALNATIRERLGPTQSSF